MLFGRWLLLFLLSSSVAPLFAQTLELYVDTVTKQVYTEAGPNRARLGVFQQVPDPATPAPAATVAAATAPAPVAGHTTAVEHAATATAAMTPAAATAPADKPAEPAKWYDKYAVRGYVQVRYNQLFDNELDQLRHQADRSVGEDQSVFIRRARLILSGDINEHMSLYLQPDFAVTPPGSSQTSFVQLRDFYTDISFDKKKEYRVRIGQSKVPFGFENLQSSQNRLALDRNDALNSCCKDERDLGAFFYWAPDPIRKRFKDLVSSGLKGSGDYGVVALGLYNGEGANRFERNDNFHLVGRVTYPYLFDNGQIFEAGAQVTSGRFLPTVDSGIVLDAPANGFHDDRYGFHAVLYPQPFGLQAEWNWGRGPELSADLLSVDEDSLNGGYVQAMYRFEHDYGVFMPFVRWQQFEGAMKFERNSPATDVTETEFGLEWQPMPELELTGMYVMTDRTNVLVSPYDQISGDLLRMQLQWNY